MCERYSFTYNRPSLVEIFPGMIYKSTISSDHNIAPTNQSPVILYDQKLIIKNMIWGLIPYWKKSSYNQGTLYNARKEKITSSVSFRMPIRSKRCIIPADSFYLWYFKNKKKNAYRVKPLNEEYLLFAGIWDEWISQTNESIFSFSIITQQATDGQEEKTSRIPLLLNQENAKEWMQEQKLEKVMQIMNGQNNIELDMYQLDEAIHDLSNKSSEVHKKHEENNLLF